MEIERREIMPFANLTCLKTSKFKTGCLSINMLSPLENHTASKNALLPQVLLRGTSKHPDMESVAFALDDLYGARIEPVVRKKGEVQLFGFYGDFIDEPYILGGEDLLEKTAGLMGELLLDPLLENGSFKADYVSGERENQRDEIRSRINNKGRYAMHRLIELMCAGEKYAIDKLGDEEETARIDEVSLTSHYRDILPQTRLEIFYCGSSDFGRVEEAVLKALSGLPREKCGAPAETFLRMDTGAGSPVYHTEEMDVTQGKLAIGFRLGKAMENPNYAALMVFNALYGGDINSKLFLNVRERLSLCYTVGSMLELRKGIMVVSSGIEFDKYDEAKTEIFSQLEAIKEGKVEDWELDCARKSVMTSLLTAMDHQSQLEDFYIGQTVGGPQDSPEELVRAAENVKADEVSAIAGQALTDMVYFLKGKAGVPVEA